jgi:hypothetical protein
MAEKKPVCSHVVYKVYIVAIMSVFVFVFAQPCHQIKGNIIFELLKI